MGVATVLVIDDDENNRLLLATLLEYAGHSVLKADCGIAGALLAAQQKPDLVVIDLSLPDISGLALIRSLRNDPATANLPIALYTATAISSSLQDLIDAYDIRGVIPKPGDPRQVLNLFARLLDPPHA
jgi:CheY-like chemotaxis protein